MKRILLIFLCLLCLLTARSIEKQWDVTDGLPTGEVHQLVELPNGQMLVNCEGVFCLSNGRGFQTVPCNYGRAYRLPHFSQGYAQQWQGDSLLWLRDFYRIFLFDARIRSFRYDIEERVTEDLMRRFKPSPLTLTDRQGGVWDGTVSNGIRYTPPVRQMAEVITDDPLVGLARSTVDSQGRVWHCKADGLDCEQDGRVIHYDTGNVISLPHNSMKFIMELSPGKYLLCVALNQLGYFYPGRKEFVPLNNRLPALKDFRFFVGACLLDGKWAAVYTQNGAFMLNTETDTLAIFPGAAEIEGYSSKYNCMVRDSSDNLWIGTQNGLFQMKREGRKNEGWEIVHVDGLANNCIRSLVLDSNNNLWVGTSFGISRIVCDKSSSSKPVVINYGQEDGVPAASMMERAAVLAPDGRLVFVFSGSSAVTFQPDWLEPEKPESLTVVMIAVERDGELIPLEELAGELIFDYDQNNFKFQFSALNYASPTHTRYRYRLEGLEKEWQYSSFSDGSLCETAYRALPPGGYFFEVQAAGDNGEWGNTTRLALTIRPPFWLTWWARLFYLLVGCAAVAALLTFYLKRKRQKMERENDRRVNRLFELREEARHEFAENTNIDPQKIAVNSEEEQLAEQMLKAIETRLSDADYGVDQLAQDVCMSRSALYTKLRNMLGISPADFIRNVRLKHAAQLLSDTDLAIGEIADRVGYNTHKAFSANFKKMFGVLPSEYRSPSIQDK